MYNLYLIRTAKVCKSCGMPAKVNAGKTVSQKVNHTFSVLEFENQETTKIIDQYDGLRDTVLKYGCIFFSDKTNNFSQCTTNQEIIRRVCSE